MPIYEFYCEDCHRIYRFLSRRVNPEAQPACPRCERPGLERKPSTFAVSRNLKEPDSSDPLEKIDEAKLERAMMELASEADKIDEEDPRQAASFLRRIYQAAGLPMGGAVEEMIRRMEAGEDPEALEQEYGDLLDEDPLLGEGNGDGAGAVKKTPGGRVERLRRRLPPSVDPELYEL